MDAAGARDPASDKSRSAHVGKGHERREGRPEKDDYVSRSPSGQRQRSIQPDGRNEYPLDVLEPTRFEPANDVV